MKTLIYGHHNDYSSIEEARAACDALTLDTEGMLWNGEKYYDSDTKTGWWPVEEYELDDAGEIVQSIDLIGYIREV